MAIKPTIREQKVAIFSPKKWYNTLSEEYKKFHKHLDNFDKGAFLKFLPRETKDKTILELWAGDGRIFSHLIKKPKTYIACDIAERLLNKHPGWKNIKKVICDLEDELPFKTESIDIVLSFFVIEHIENIEQLFSEISRILKPGGTAIIGHFLQRRAAIFKDWKKKYKIDRFNYTHTFLCKQAECYFWKVANKAIYEKNVLIWHIIIFSS